MIEGLSPEDELAALIAEQQRDDEWGHRVDAPRAPTHHKTLSLDYTFEGGGTTGETVGGPDVALEALMGADEMIVRRIPRPQKWTRRAILKHIRAWVREHGEIPKHQDWNRPNGRGIPSSASLARHFGSFNAAIQAAGFEPRGIGKCDPNPVPEGRGRKRVRPHQRRGARLTSDDLAAAYVLYERQRLSLPEIAELVWQRYGYPGAKACRGALWKGFHAEGFPLRSKSEARLCLGAEKRREISLAMQAGRKSRQQKAAA